MAQHPIKGAKILHKTRAPGKCKFFMWLALHDRCWTADRRKRHGLQSDDTCVLCSQLPETIDHLLVGCPFSREIWFKVLRWLGWEMVAPSTHTTNLSDWWLAARKDVPKNGRNGFDSMVVLVCWLFWKERNNRTFDRRVRTIQDVVLKVADEIVLWVQAGFRHLDMVASALGRSPGRNTVIL